MEAQTMAPAAEVSAPSAAVDNVMNSGEVAVAVQASSEVPMAQASQGWFEMISAKFPSSVPPWAIELGVFGVASFLLGFLFKCCGRFLVVALIVGIAILLGLHFSNVRPIDFVQLKQLAGFANVATLQEVPMICFEWAKAHITACISVVVGFIVGWKLG